MRNTEMTSIEQNRKITELYNQRKDTESKDGCLSILIDDLIVQCREIDDDRGYNRHAYLLNDFVEEAIKYLIEELNGTLGVKEENGSEYFVYIFEGFVYKVHFKVLDEFGDLEHQRYLGATLLTGMSLPIGKD